MSVADKNGAREPEKFQLVRGLPVGYLCIEVKDLNSGLPIKIAVCLKI